MFLGGFLVDWSAAERVVLGDLLLSAFLPKASDWMKCDCVCHVLWIMSMVSYFKSPLV